MNYGASNLECRAVTSAATTATAGKPRSRCRPAARQLPGCLPKGFTPDSLLNRAEAQRYLRLNDEQWTKKKRHIPGLRCETNQTVWFHPRTFMAALEREGVGK